MTRKENKEKSTAVQQQGKSQKHKYENKKSATLAQQGPIKAKCKIARSDDGRDE